MALETPNQTIASAVLLFQNMLTVGEETVEFASSNGFASVRFIDPDTPIDGVVLPLSNPVNNQEGTVAVNGDINAGGVFPCAAAYITPNHSQVDPLLDDLDPNQVVLGELEGLDEVFRISVNVLGQQAILPPDEAEPVP